MSRQVQFVVDAEPYKAGDIVVIDDQAACNAIATGKAVPNIDPLPEEPQWDEIDAAAPPDPVLEKWLQEDVVPAGPESEQ